MNLSMHNQALLRGILAGAVVLSGASGCSRSDRAGAGRDTTQTSATAVTPSDTQTSASATQPSAGASTQPSGDTAMTTTRDTARATAQTPTSQPSRPSNRRVRPDTTVKSDEEAVSGYRGMERDSSTQPEPSAATRNTADSAEVSSDSSVGASPDTTSAEVGTGAASPLDSAGVTSDYALTADTSAVGYSEMAADTSSAAGRADTAAVAVTDTAAQAESDTANIQVQMDTTTAQAQADTTAAVHPDTLTVAAADSAASTKGEQAAAQAGNADTLQENAGRIRPPEDSTEILGNVTGDTTSAASGNVASQSEVERIRPPEDSTEIRGNVTGDKDRAEATSREAPTDATGAAPIGPTLTGIEAVALMSRAGARCIVKDDSSDVWWDMADSPAALNPCGTGTMTLSLVRTGEK